MEYNRFELEQKILRCWGIIDDLRLIQNNEKMTEEQMQEFIKATITLYEVKFDDLFGYFSKMILEKKIT